MTCKRLVRPVCVGNIRIVNWLKTILLVVLANDEIQVSFFYAMIFSLCCPEVLSVPKRKWVLRDGFYADYLSCLVE